MAALALLLAACVPGAKTDPNVRARLISEQESIRPGRPFWLGVQLDMKPGWHTYWKNPGESGMATSIVWDLPKGFKAGALLWPYPERFESPAGVSYGYEGSALLLAEIVPPGGLKPGSDVSLAARVSWLECADACLPGKAGLRVRLPVQSDRPKKIDPESGILFSEARRKIPFLDRGWRLSAQGAGGRVRILASSRGGDRGLAGLRFFPEAAGMIRDAGPQTFSRRGGGYVLEMEGPEAAPPKSLKGVLVLVEEGEGTGGPLKSLAIDLRLE